VCFGEPWILSLLLVGCLCCLANKHEIPGCSRYLYAWGSPDKRVNQWVDRDNNMYTTVQTLINGRLSAPLPMNRFHMDLSTGLQLPENLFLKKRRKRGGEKSVKKPWILMALPGSMCNSFNYKSTNVLAHSCGNTHGSSPRAENCPAN